MAKVTYNNLSDRFKKEIKWGVPPSRDEVIEFQLINIPIVKQNGEMLPIYGNQRIPNMDSVYDPYMKDGNGKEIGGMVQIAYVTKETGNDNKPYEFGEIEMLRINKGTLTISGKEPSKYGLLWFLRACNYNQSNALSNPGSVGYLFKELEPVKTAAQKLKERRELQDCINYITDLKEAEIVSLLSALKLAVLPSIEENTMALIDFVQSKEKRDKFNGLAKDARTPVAALITKAEKLELIRYNKDPKTWSYVATNKIITQVAPQTDHYEHLLDYFHNNVTGRAFKDFIEKEIESIDAEKAKLGSEKALEKAEKE